MSRSPPRSRNAARKRRARPAQRPLASRRSGGPRRGRRRRSGRRAVRLAAGGATQRRELRPLRAGERGFGPFSVVNNPCSAPREVLAGRPSPGPLLTHPRSPCPGRAVPRALSLLFSTLGLRGSAAFGRIQPKSSCLCCRISRAVAGGDTSEGVLGSAVCIAPEQGPPVSLWGWLWWLLSPG